MKAVHYSHQGKRDNQEDAYGFTNRAYLVCDGVGGHEKGEVASNFVVDFMKNELPKLEQLTKANLQELVLDAQKALNEQLQTQSEATGMGTTFAGVFKSEQVLFVAHLGDSRVYWVKPKTKQIWHTWDHSMVGNLMQMGEISREEGRFHPQGNRISKAIIANSENKLVKPDIAKITEYDEGDLFFICSDGVTESWSEFELLELLCDNGKSIEEKLDLIKQKCAAESKDNNTAILIQVESDSAVNGAPNDEITWLSLDYFRKDFESYHTPEEVEIPAEINAEEPIELELIRESENAFPPLPEMPDVQNDSKKKIFIAIVLIIIALLAVFFIKKLNGGEQTGDGLLILSKENQLYGYKNSNGDWVIPARFIAAEPFDDERAKVSTEDSVFYINEMGQMIAFIGLVNGEEEQSSTSEKTDISPGTATSPNNPISSGLSSAQAHVAPSSGGNNPFGIGSNEDNMEGGAGHVSQNWFENEAQIEKAYQKLIKTYSDKKIPPLEEKNFLSRIKDPSVRETYRKKISKHNTSVLVQPSAPQPNFSEPQPSVSEPQPSEPEPSEPTPPNSFHKP